MTAIQRYPAGGVMLVAAILLVVPPPQAVRSTPLRTLGCELADDALIGAVAGAALSGAFELVLGAAQRREDRPAVVEGLLHAMPAFTEFERFLLLTRYLEESWLSAFAAEVPVATMAVLSRDLHTFNDPGLNAAYFAMAVRYHLPPPRSVLLATGVRLSERLREGAADPTLRRFAVAYLRSLLLDPHPALGGVADRVRRSARDRDIVELAADISRRLFD